MTSFERIILESLKEKPKNLTALIQDTGLSDRIVINTLNVLLDADIIQHYSSGYCLNLKTLSKFTGDKREEVKELMMGIVDQCFEQKKSNISLKKVWMTKEDEKIFKAMLDNIDRFLGELKIENQNSKLPLGEKKVFYWGLSPYKNALQAQIRMMA